MADMRLIVAGAGGRMGRNADPGDCGDAGGLACGRGRGRGRGRDRARFRGTRWARAKRHRGHDRSRAAACQGGRAHRLHGAGCDPGLLGATAGRVHIIGTTGLTAEDDALIAQAAQRTTVVKSGNMSLGVNLLAALVKRVAKTLDQDFDIEILERCTTAGRSMRRRALR